MAFNIIGFTLLYFLPGYLAINLLLPEKKHWENLAYTMPLSIAINTFTAYAIALTGHLGTATIHMAILLASASLYLLHYIRKTPLYVRTEKAWRNPEPKIPVKHLKKAAPLLIAILFASYVVYKPHHSYTGTYQNPYVIEAYQDAKSQSYPYPLHVDEWTHLAQAIYIMRAGTRGFTNPYTPDLEYHLDWESGFHIFTAAHFLLTNTGPVLTYKYLPALFAAITALTIFAFMKRITDYRTAILAILFTATLKSNINLLGTWFFIPLTMSIPYIYLILTHLTQSRQDKGRHIILILLYLLLLAILYPPAAVLAAVTILLYMISTLTGSPAAAIILSIILVAGFLLTHEKITEGLQWLKFPSTWTGTTMGAVKYKIPALAGTPNTILALAGAIISLRKKSWIILAPAIILIGNLAFYGQTDSAFIIPYQRTVYYLIALMAPLSAIGLGRTIKAISKKTGAGTLAKTGLTLAIMLLVLNWSFDNYYDISKQDISNQPAINLVLMHTVDDTEYKALKHIKYHFPENSVVLANPVLSIAIYPISQNQAVSILPTNLGGERRLSAFPQFLNADCRGKNRLARKFRANVIITRTPIECEGLMPEGVFKQYYLYRMVRG